MIVLMKRIAHAVSVIGEKPALLTEGGLLLCHQGQPSQGGSCRAGPRYGGKRVVAFAAPSRNSRARHASGATTRAAIANG